MGYVAVKGGKEAIANAEEYMKYRRDSGTSPALTVAQIQEHLNRGVDRIMSEGSLYAPDLAALALKQSAGDTLEASFILRAYRTTQPRLGYSEVLLPEKMRVIRRISSAFKDIPGGQLLGPTTDYTVKLMDFGLYSTTEEDFDERVETLLAEAGVQPIGESPQELPKIIQLLRQEGLLPDIAYDTSQSPCDITRNSPVFPASRSAAMQTMARGETGALLTLAYSNMRGYGDIHPTVGELRVGYMPVAIEHPLTGEPYTIGEILITEAEVIAKLESECGAPQFTLGYGVCFGHNEVKAISMAVLDRAMQTESPKHISENQEFVLSHVDGIESMGFAIHYKLPHYVTFQSDLDRLRKARDVQDEF